MTPYGTKGSRHSTKRPTRRSRAVHPDMLWTCSSGDGRFIMSATSTLSGDRIMAPWRLCRFCSSRKCCFRARVSPDRQPSRAPGFHRAAHSCGGRTFLSDRPPRGRSPSAVRLLLTTSRMYMRGVNKDCHTALERSGTGTLTRSRTERLIRVPPYLNPRKVSVDVRPGRSEHPRWGYQHRFRDLHQGRSDRRDQGR